MTEKTKKHYFVLDNTGMVTVVEGVTEHRISRVFSHCCCRLRRHCRQSLHFPLSECNATAIKHRQTHWSPRCIL